MQLLSAVPEQHFTYVVQTNLAPFYSTDSSFQNRSLGLHQFSKSRSTLVYQTWPAFGYRSFLGPSSFCFSIEFIKTLKHKLMSFEKCTSGQQSSNFFVILYLVRSHMPLVSNHMPFQKVEPSAGHHIPFNNIYITAFVASIWPLSGSPVSLGLEMYTKTHFLNGFSFSLFKQATSCL